MILNEDSAMEVVRNPRHKQHIQSVKDQESQLRVFTEEMSEYELRNETYWTKLMGIMKARVEKKFDRVCQFARYPLPIVQLSDSILNDYFKVFEGKNRYFNVEGDRDIQKLEDWIEDSKLDDWIEKKARQVFKNKPNSFVVVDLDDQGSPYLVFVDSERVVDVQLKNMDGDCDYIAFIHSQVSHETKVNVTTTFFSVYDDVNYYVFSKDSDSDNLIKVEEINHGIGYCPARSFIKSPSNSTNIFKRRVAFSSALSKMEDWTIFDIFRNYVDHYAPFPVTEAPERTCYNPECDNGKVSEEVVVDARSGETKTVWSDCQACGGKDEGQGTGPGTHIGIQVQEDKTMNDGSGVFRMIYPESDKLKYVPEKLDDIELEIRYKTVGLNNLMSNEAFNEMQVKGSFASMESVLLRVKTELDVLYKWIVSTVGEIFYKDLFLNVEANFGTEFYLVSEDDLQNRYDNAKKIGLPLVEQLNIYKQLIQTKYKGNTNKTSRELMLLDLDPFPMYSLDECIVLKRESVLDDFQLSFKVNFLKFISKFEFENIEITQFGKNLEYEQRIDLIEKTLHLYNQELIDDKNARNNPNNDVEDSDAPQVTQEQLEAQARLKGTVGGVQGIIGLLESKASGIISLESAIQTMIQIYGFNRDIAEKILGEEMKNNLNININDSKQLRSSDQGVE